LVIAACEKRKGNESALEHHETHNPHHDSEDAEFERGPHQGRMLRDGPFAIELQIFEKGVPPQYRVYGYFNDSPIEPGVFSVNVELRRLGRGVEKITFHERGTFQLGDKTIDEPHSFEVAVTADYQGKRSSWNFSSFEGRTTIPEEIAAISGIKTETAMPNRLQIKTRLQGKIRPSEHRIAHVMPRFPGIIREGKKHIGDQVTKGEVLAIVESNESLQPFEVRSQLSGTIIEGHVVAGEFVPENTAIYTVADFSEMWVDCYLPLREERLIKIGQKVPLSTIHGTISTEAEVIYVAPYADEHSQSRLVRLVINNPQGKFLPGMYLSGELLVEEKPVSVAVRRSSIQHFRDWDVVFRVVGDVYEVAPIVRGSTDDEWVEVISGLMPGDKYVTENPFLIKADILKSGASHDH